MEYLRIKFRKCWHLGYFSLYSCCKLFNIPSITKIRKDFTIRLRWRVVDGMLVANQLQEIKKIPHISIIIKLY
jgi:hypothetical protein